MEIKLVLYLPRDALSVPVSRQVLDRCLETLGVTPNTRADIALALTEACANVIQHAGSGEEYEVQVSAKNRRCAIEVVNAGRRDGRPVLDGSVAAVQDSAVQDSAVRDGGRGFGEAQPDGFALTDDPLAAIGEHGRGLKIIDALTDNLQLTGNQRQGTTVHFEKTLDWLPGAAGPHLFNADDGVPERGCGLAPRKFNGRTAGSGRAGPGRARRRGSRRGAGRWRRRARRSRPATAAARRRAGWSRAGSWCGHRGWSS
jgi:serine/threonine-protein kinase RsbW